MSSLLGMTRKYTGGGVVPPYKYRGGGTVGSTDTVPAMLTPGEVVLNAGQQQRLGAMTGVPSDALFNAAGVPGFQGGGEVPDIGQHLYNQILANIESASKDYTPREMPTGTRRERRELIRPYASAIHDYATSARTHGSTEYEDTMF